MTLFDTLRSGFQGKKVFLTGHTGFKGTWMSLLLHQLGAEVTGFSLPPESPSLYTDLQADRYMHHSILGDIRHQDTLVHALLEAQPDMVFHMAAQPLVLDGYQRPVYTYEVNALGTAHLLEGVRQLQKPCQVVVITTDKVYHNNEWIYPYRETDALGGYDPYSASKACTELITASYRSSFFHPQAFGQHRKSIATVRAGNVIGGGDWAANRILPDIARSIAQQQSVVLRNPHAVRPWQHVLEALVGYLQLALRLQAEPQSALWADAWNFGPAVDEQVTVLQVVQQAIAVWGQGTYTIEQDEHRPHEAHLLRLDCSKALGVLGWKPKMSAMEAIAFTASWYKDVLTEGLSAEEVTFRQLSEYFAK